MREIARKLKHCHIVVTHESTSADVVNLITLGQITKSLALNKDFFGEVGRVGIVARESRDWGCGRGMD